MKDSQQAAELRQGVIVLIALAGLTGAEYYIAVTWQLWAVLLVIGLIKAIMVIEYYMHLPRVFSEAGGH